MAGVSDKERISRETLKDFASVCHDVFAGRGSVVYGVKGREHQHKNELPADGHSTPWPLWLAVEKTIFELPLQDMQRLDLDQVTQRLYDGYPECCSPDYRRNTWSHMKSVAALAQQRAAIMAAD